MKKTTASLITGTALLLAASSCTKMRDTGVLNTGNFTDTTAALKDLTDITMGTAVDYSTMVNDARYAAIVKRDFDGVTFGYSMKHGAIVRDNGAYNYTNADAIVAASSGLTIFGHTLLWHANQNATFLKSYAGITVAAAAELITSNPGFESGLSGWSVFNTGNPAGTATITATTAAGDARTGSGAMKVVTPVAYAGNQWRVQVSSAAFATIPGRQYVISYWVKAASAGGSIRLSLGTAGQGGTQYQGDQTIGTTYQNITFQFTANATTNTFLFDMGQAANTYYIDDASVKEVVTAPSGSQIAAKVDTALMTYVNNMIGRYKNTVKAWDVVNEPMSPGGGLRTSVNSSDVANKTASDVFFWGDYLGRSFALNAFRYAAAADPAAKLFINDYALESSTAKLDSLLAYVAELKGKGAKIDGIGTQMHINWNTSYAGIGAMMQKLAATGLLVRISELDVRINPLTKPNFVLTPLEANYQAAMYKYVIQSYLKYVPKAQQYGITIWGITDNTSWLYNNGQDFPLLYNSDYTKKQAYAATMQALRGQ